MNRRNYRKLMYVKIDRIVSTNSKLDRAVIEEIKKDIDLKKLAAFPAWHDGSRNEWVITDGNHRLQALKELEYAYAPIIEISRKEFDLIAWEKKEIDIIVVVPKKIKVIGI